jgi:hypothetical protein
MVNSISVRTIKAKLQSGPRNNSRRAEFGAALSASVPPARSRLLGHAPPRLSRDTKFYAVGGHQLLRTDLLGNSGFFRGTRARRSRARGPLKNPVQLAQPVAPPVDVDDVHVVEQAVQDGGDGKLDTCGLTFQGKWRRALAPNPPLGGKHGAPSVHFTHLVRRSG